MAQRQHHIGHEATSTDTGLSALVVQRRSRLRRRLARRMAGLVLAPLLIGLAAQAAPAAASTTVGGAYTVSGTSQLWDIACPTTTICYAAGQSSSQAGVIVPVTNNGIPGSPLTVPGTAGLQGITCPTSTTCYAVGWTNGSSEEGVLVTLPVGGTPTVQPISGTRSLGAIACPSSTTCEAVGPGPGVWVAPAPATLVTIPTGGSGSLSVQILGTDAMPIALDSIACLGQTCYAGGSTYYGSTRDAVIVTVPQGGTPTTQTLSISSIQDIACGGITCYALGESHSPYPDGVWVETVHQDGTLSGTQVANVQFLGGIACPTTSFCAAVGQSQGGSAVVINPASPTPDIEPSDAPLQRITCKGTSPSYTCYAVGASGSGTNWIGAVETITVRPTQTPPPCKTPCQ